MTRQQHETKISYIPVVTDDDEDDGQANGDNVTPLSSDMTSLREAIENAIVPLDEVDVSDVTTKIPTKQMNFHQS